MRQQTRPSLVQIMSSSNGWHASILSIGPLRIKFNEIWHWMSSAPQCVPAYKISGMRYICIHAHPFSPMMTSSNGNIFRVTGPLCGEFTGHRRIKDQVKAILTETAGHGWRIFYSWTSIGDLGKAYIFCTMLKPFRLIVDGNCLVTYGRQHFI